MGELRETVILGVNEIKITNARAVIGANTYEMSTIISVSLEEKNLSPVVGTAVVIVSLISLVIGFLSCLAALSISFVRMIMIGYLSDWPRINVHFLFAVLGLLFIYLWSIGWEADKPTYIIQIETASGKSKVLETRDKDYLQRIINAINDAIAPRDKDGANPSLPLG
jgi:hypothetical protein